MLLLPDGDLLIGGETTTAGGDPVLVRYDGDDGSLTNTFGGDGFAATDFGAADEYLEDIAVQPDGDVVGVGAQGTTGAETAARVFRFDGDSGLADNGFDFDGSVTLPLPATTPVPADTRRELTSVALQPDGEIVVAGVNGDDLSPLTDSSLVLARFDSAGVQDGNFGPGGLVSQKLPLTGFQSPTGAEDILLQNDGKVLRRGPHGLRWLRASLPADWPPRPRLRRERRLRGESSAPQRARRSSRSGSPATAS